MDEIHFLLGNNCNLNCDFCFWSKRIEDTSLDFKKSIIDDICKTNIKKITISGGEPTISKDFKSILKYAKEKGLTLVLHTNGLIIDDDLAKYISKYVSRVSLTFDSNNVDTIKQLRGNVDIIKKTLFLIDLFDKLKVDVNVKTLVSKINIDELEEIGNVLCNQHVKYWSLLKFNPIDRGNTNKDSFYVSDNLFKEKTKEIKDKFSELDIRIRDFSENKKPYCFVTVDGNIYTYKENEDIKIGNVKDGLSNILLRL